MKRTVLLVMCVVLSACAGVLGIKPRRDDHPFEHRAHALRGIGCTSCHSRIATAKDAPLPPTAKCLECHARPHDTRECGACHGEPHVREEVRLAKEHIVFDHTVHVPRLTGQCVPCHRAAGDAEPVALRPTMAQCLACHSDRWTTRDCDRCHKDLPQEAVMPSSHVVHEGDFLREHGVRAAASRDLCATCHSDTSCAKCHGVTTADLPWRFTMTQPRATGLHRAGFLARHREEAHANPGTCASCHDAERFCRSCHEKKARLGPGRSPHPPDWVRARGGGHGRAARLDPVSCASCHSGSGEALCIGCHRVGGPGGNPHGSGFRRAEDPSTHPSCTPCHAR